MRFEDLNVDPRCLRTLHKSNITEPTPVQEQAIPVVLSGGDLIATAQTGTGKTLAFTLPAMMRLAESKPGPARMLVLTPTRELAQQVETVMAPIARTLRLTSVVVYGGAGMQQQADRLRRGCDVIVATPGRLLDHMSRKAVRFDGLQILCFDEADRMLDMGFLPDIRRILAHLPKERQTLMFSATFAPELQRLVGEMMHDPARIGIEVSARPVDAVRQVVYPVRQEEKAGLLLSLLKEQEKEMESVLVFMRTKSRTDRVGRMLKAANIKAAVIHGDLPQGARQRALESFRTGKCPILVATDVAARGLDVDGISHVINYDIPQTADDYIHRIGRTARAQREGDAITFVCPSDISPLGTIEKTLGYNLPRIEREGAPVVLSTYRKTAAGGATRNRRPRSLLRRR